MPPLPCENLKDRGDSDLQTYISQLQDYCTLSAYQLTKENFIQTIKDSNTRTNNVYLWFILSVFFKKFNESKATKALVESSTIMRLIVDTDVSEARKIADVIEVVAKTLLTRFTESENYDGAKDLCIRIISLLQKDNQKVITSFHGPLMRLLFKENDVTGSIDYINMDDFQLLNENGSNLKKCFNPAIDPISLMTYFYYSGCICLKLKRYVDAYILFESVIMLTSKGENQPHDLFISSTQKYILAGILAFKKSPSIISIMTNDLSRTFTYYQNDYISILKIFKNGLNISNDTYETFLAILKTIKEKSDDVSKENYRYLCIIDEYAIKYSVVKYKKIYDKIYGSDLRLKSLLPKDVNMKEYLEKICLEDGYNITIDDNDIVTFHESNNVDTSSVYTLCGEIEVMEQKLMVLKNIIYKTLYDKECFMDGKFDLKKVEVISTTIDEKY